MATGRNNMAGELKRYLAAIGSKGGKTTGASKRRGDAAYYKRISKKAAQARKRKAANAKLCGLRDNEKGTE